MKCCPLEGLAAEAETSVCPVPAVSAAAGKLAAAAMPPAIRTLRREARAGIWSFNSESSWSVCVDSFNSMPGALRSGSDDADFPDDIVASRGTEVKLLQIKCRELQTHCFAYCNAHLSGHRIVSPQSDAARVIESVELRCE